MMKLENNQYHNPYFAGAPWDKTPDGQLCALDTYLPSRDVIPIVKQLYGTQNPDNLAVYVLENNWAQNNEDLAEMFLTEDSLTPEICIAVGY
jgi:hypothetical protein